LTLDGTNALFNSTIEGLGIGTTLSGGATSAQQTIVGSGPGTVGQVLQADGAGNWTFGSGGGGLDQLTGDGTAGPGTGSQVLTVVSMQTGQVTANVPAAGVAGGTISGFRQAAAAQTGYTLGQGASSSHITALCFGYANITGPPWVGTANYAIAGTNTDTYIAPAGGVNNNIWFGYDQSDPLFSMHMNAGGAGGNFQFGTTQNFGGGAGVVGFEGATTQPSTNPAANGAILWAHADGATGHSSLFFRDDQGNVYDLSAGSSGITALTGDVTASGSGSVAATVVQITGTGGTANVVSGTSLTFVPASGHTSTTGRLNFSGDTGAPYTILAITNYLNSGTNALIATDGAGDYYFGKGTLTAETVSYGGGSIGNAMVMENAGALFNSSTMRLTSTPLFADSASNVTIGALAADYGGATGLLSFAPETQPTSLPATDVGLYATTAGQSLGINGLGITFSTYATSVAITQTQLAAVAGTGNAGFAMAVTGQAGQATTGNLNAPGVGGNLTDTAGAGGASTGLNTNGAAGGNYTATGGAGGAAPGATSTGGAGGNAFLMGGAGGVGAGANGAIGGAGMGAAGTVYLSVGGSGGAGLGLVAKPITTTGGTLTLSVAQYLYGRLGINGSLSGALTIIFPNTTGLWLLDLTGLTTGAFTTITIQSGSASTVITSAGPSAGVGQAHWIVTNGSNTLAVI
jgi:hypothetical protein